MKHLALTAVLATALVTLAAAPQTSKKDQGWVQRDSLQLSPVPAGFTFQCLVNNPVPRPVTGNFNVAIKDLDGKTLLETDREVELRSGANDVSLFLEGDLPGTQIPLCVVHYTLRSSAGGDSGSRSLLSALAQLETRVVAYRDLQAGSTASIRLVALNHATGRPVPNAAVSLVLGTDQGDVTLYQGRTDERGTLDAQFEIPGDVRGEAQLKIAVAAQGLGEDMLVQPVSVKRDTKILLTTDKPLYQPGHVIQMRALSLNAATLDAAAGQELIFEVMDSKGNKVFKKAKTTDEYGIASADFQLASEVNLGSYIVRAILGENQTEKQVTVERYVLPKFKIELTPDKDFYLPGETLKGRVQADYFFGKPVAGGAVTITASKFEVEFTEFAEVEGTLDEQGAWSFELQLPDYFAGTPIEQGKASVRLEAVVIDTADHREEKVVMTPVAEAPLTIHAVPESGELIPGIENRVYILVAYPDGRPVEGARVSVSGEGVQEPEVTADALGIATITMTRDEHWTSMLNLVAKDAQGREVSESVEMNWKAQEVSVLLRTDKALYTVGDTLHVEALASKPAGTVYFDLVRNGQTVMTRAAELTAGKAELDLELDATVSGSVILQAYTFTPGTDIVRDTRLLYVNSADSLRLDVALAKETYQPGQDAEIRFGVTDVAGTAVPAALGIAIVDESVFALQEIHPGLEKVYFTLEQEIMQPRYEIHGYALDDLVVEPAAAPQELKSWTDRQQRAAEVLLASAPEPPMPPVIVNTFAQKQQAANQAISERIDSDFQRIESAVRQYTRRNKGYLRGDILDALQRGKYLRPNDLLDPWGNPYVFDFSGIQHNVFTMTSYGPDEIKGTGDDIMRTSAPPAVPVMAMPMAMEEGLAVRGGLGGGGGFAMDVTGKAKLGDVEIYQSHVEPSFSQPVRLRQYFPETLLFEPALITDAQGMATLTVPMADSITTWRMTTMASSAQGLLGSKDTPIRVFQEFFVDLDLPVALTQGDRVSIPVVLYNYLDAPQAVRLKFEQEPWFTLEGEAEQVIQLQPEEVRAMYFPIEVVELGMHRLTVYAYGSTMSDAIRREIEILPDGEEENVTVSDRLTANVEHTVTIPGNAVEGASKILVRIYPGVYSQIVDGLDSMLQMPSGCFEQTSSITYPNILIVDYMKETEQINPETQMKAEGFINAGYQRLLAYEVLGGGFSWFGDAPANKVLTAWGLKEFHDMAQVHEVDPAVIERTRAWLLGLQESDGSWKPDEQYLHAESWGNIQNSNLLVTAYVAEAILGTGLKDPQLDQAVRYIQNHLDDAKEAYVLALVANALVAWNPKDAATVNVLEKLHVLRKEEGEIAYWEGGAGTVTFTHGDAANVETTALATIAFLNAQRYPQTASKALTYLIQKKSAHGHWGSTQATILALKALLLSLSAQTEKVDAAITVTLNGEDAGRFDISPENSDVMRLLDLGDKTNTGDNTVALTIDGEGSMLYQIVGRYYTPWSGAEPMQEPMTIEVDYDKAELAVNDVITTNVKVTNSRPAAAKMVIVDLGIPPGFQVNTPDLETLVQHGTVEKYEMTGRQVILYFEEIAGSATVEFSYTLRAKFPIRAQTPGSRVYEYYNPEVSANAAPEELVVHE